MQNALNRFTPPEKRPHQTRIFFTRTEKRPAAIEIVEETKAKGRAESNTHATTVGTGITSTAAMLGRRTKARNAAPAASALVMGAVGEEFLDKALIPRSFQQFDEAVLALRGERIGAVFLAAVFRLNRHGIALQRAD